MERNPNIFDKLTDLLKFMIPGYKEGKSQLVIAIGCTGGQHRSVALAKRLAEYLNEILNICLCAS